MCSIADWNCLTLIVPHYFWNLSALTSTIVPLQVTHEPIAVVGPLKETLERAQSNAGVTA